MTTNLFLNSLFELSQSLLTNIIVPAHVAYDQRYKLCTKKKPDRRLLKGAKNSYQEVALRRI